METVSVKEMTPKQCQVLVGKYRVAYICYGDSMPINWLTKSTSGLKLTDEEKLQVAKTVRADMAQRNEVKSTVGDELAAISGSSYQSAPKAKNHGTKQIANPGRPNEAKDAANPSS